MKFYALPQNKTENEISSLRAHSRAAQEAWMKLLKINLDKPQRKTLLGLVSHHIAPWFLRIDLLMDFLVDSFNLGGSMSLVALSGLFYLIQKRNLDYPQFYTKLYGLLDAQILHSKHRSRFLRLLDTFLASTHLPAVLVASFIKRLSRLCLYSPPSGIVIIVPLIYNLLKEHPACTFMIHRETPELERKMRMKDEGLEDPFDMEEKNPMASRAIDSSLWEIETLQSHYHPNVATIAKMISEQFTKQGYNLEDFLDHSYGSVSRISPSRRLH
jgi:U3 small nucleolar RNA-associated protein 19